MQVGRELDRKVAEALGWPITDVSGDWFVRVVTDMYEGQETLEPLPQFSTSWEGMGVLVEEALKQGIGFQLETRFMDGGFIDYSCLAASKKN